MHILEQNEEQFYARYHYSLQEMASKIELQSINSVLYDKIDNCNSESFYVPLDVRLLLILGFGNGYIINSLMNEMDNEISIIIYEPDKEHFLYACMNHDISDLIGRTNLEIVFGDGEIKELLRSGIKRLTGVLNIKHIFFRALPGYSDNYPGFDRGMIEAVKEVLMSQAAEYVTEISYCRAIYKNQLYALSLLHFSSLFSELLAAFPDKNMPIVLVGAGPSLNQNAAALKEVDGRALIIACTRAMSTLDQNGVCADLVAMVDMEEGHDFCTHDTDRQYRLLFHSQSAADIQKEYIGRGIYFGFQKERYPLKGLDKENDSFSTGGSVITCIFSIFLQAGFKRFILVGEDLAYSEEGKTHTGSFQEKTKEKIFETESIHGGMIRTRSDWQIFRAFFEQEIMAHPEILVIDATEGGALIHGSEVMTLKEAMEYLGQDRYAIKDILDRLPVGYKDDLDEVSAFYDQIISQCGEMQYLIKEALLWNDRIRNMGRVAREDSLNNAVKKYNDLYDEIVDEKKADLLKGFSADVVFSYTDKAQYLLSDDKYDERLNLEKDFLNDLLAADIELIEYVSSVKAAMKLMNRGTVLQVNENAFLRRYGISLRAKVKKLKDITEKSLCKDGMATDADSCSNGDYADKDTLLFLLFGFGNGDEIRGILLDAAENSRIVIYEPDMLSFLEVVKKKDISDIIISDRILIILEKDELMKAIDINLGHANLDHKRIICLSSDRDMKDHKFDEFRSIINEREQYLRRAGFSWEFLGENLCINEIYALSQLKDNFLLRDMFDNIPDRNIPLILVAAGPSLRKNALHLRKAYGKAIIVAVAHAWPVLEELGISVDFIARHDGMQGKDTGFLKADTERAQRMLLAASSGYEIQQEYNGKCYYYGFSDEIFRDESLKNEYLSDNRGGSIATDVFELFTASGFKNIILVGQDLAYGADGESHASGSDSNKNTGFSRLETEGINGEMVRTREDWLMFLKFYERLISENPDLNVIDATEGGARIKGTMIMPLSSAIDEMCGTEYQLNEWIEGTKAAGSIHGDDIGKRSLVRQRECIEKIKKLIREMLILSDRICARLHMEKADDPEFAKDCDAYDHLYHRILDGDEAALLCYYSQADIQKYIRDALLTDRDPLAKIESEQSLFKKLQGRSVDLGSLLDRFTVAEDTEKTKKEKSVVDDLIEKVKDFYGGDFDCLADLYYMMRDYMDLPVEYRRNKSNKLCKELLTMITSNPLLVPYFMLSAVLEMTENKEVFQHLLHLCIDDEQLTKENRHFVYYQLLRYKFVHPEVDSRENDNLMDDLYERIYKAYKKELSDRFIKISRENRNKDFVIVLTTQALTINHGPTKVLFDRSYILEEYLGKKIYIINTAEMMSQYGEMEWFGATEPNYYEEYNEKEYLRYKGKEFAFLQCPREMPNVDVIRQILELIFDTKPWCVVAIDGSCITADMCAEIVPTITINLSNNRAVTRTTYQMLSHKRSEEDDIWLKKHGLPREHFIDGVFTFALKEQKLKLTKEQLGLPVNNTVCVVVGARLNMEVTPEFIELINRLAEKGICTAFVGDYKRFDEAYGNYPLLRDHFMGLGYQEDTLAVFECCDIYLNPTRSGGGTSAAEAMYKGLPVVTTDYGDIAIAAGEEFIVADYNEMYDEVIRLSEDKAYYSEKSQRARQRAERLTDSKGEFVRIMQEMESRSLFF